MCRRHRLTGLLPPSGSSRPHRETVLAPALLGLLVAAQLGRAYDELMKLYGPAEPARNRAAFFDYHCALDFL